MKTRPRRRSRRNPEQTFEIIVGSMLLTFAAAMLTLLYAYAFTTL